jgi:hypothetical protein
LNSEDDITIVSPYLKIVPSITLIFVSPTLTDVDNLVQVSLRIAPEIFKWPDVIIVLKPTSVNEFTVYDYVA